MEAWAATELHPSSKPGFDGTMDLKTGLVWPEMLRFWIRETVPEDFGIWGLVGAQDHPPSWQERTERGSWPRGGLV